ncbi:MAG: amino acid permease, partial [Clostridia bacterium]|nr:amino acid permease [Clostridia bacterium]
MNNTTANKVERRTAPYLSTLGAWALAFGCSVGWGSFVMPGTTFLPIAGPLGTAIGIALGALVMLVIAKNYHYLINVYPDGGGAYTYIKKSFGYDHGFLNAWFLVLTYIAIIWANATALPLIARALLGNTFQFGFHYQIAGFDVYFGELLLVIAALAAGALICLNKKISEKTQIITALLLFSGVVVCFVAAAAENGVSGITDPAFSPDHAGLGGTITIFALAPWAFVGFESISHSAHEAKFPLKRSFGIMAAALAAAAVAYAFLSLSAATARPDGASSWTDYIAGLGEMTGVASLPTFFAAFSALGIAGEVILGVAALGAIFTGIIGNYIALSRLVNCMHDDGLLPTSIGKLDKNGVPRRAICFILGISVILPFFGRTAISWIVDVTTVGATIAFAFTSAAAIKTARGNKDGKAAAFGIVGLVVSLLFAFEFLIPNITSVKTLSTESYLILAAWGILGFIVFYLLLKNDRERHFGRSTVAWIVLLGLIIFTSSVWMRQSASSEIDSAIYQIGAEYSDELQSSLDRVESSILMATVIQVSLIVSALAVLFVIYSKIQKREKQIEVEKILAEESSRAKTSFLSNMSHEIRTPMNAIIGLDNIALRDPDLTPRTREQLTKIGSSAKHLLGLINDILDMSRIESGRMVLKSEEFSFREFIEQINIIINGQCLDKGLHYDCRIVGQIADYYVGDDMKLKQVLINILGNSVKFTDAPGEVTLTVEQTARDDDGCTLRFVMRDTGIGMDKEFIPKIFEAFSQEDATTTNRYGGSGLGMAITKNFIEMMNGTIDVESEKGVGSVFTVTVVLKPSERRFAPDSGISLPKDIHAVIVDDDDIAGEHAKFVLDSLGVEAEAFTSAGQALKLIKDAYESGHPYKLVLTDYKMPDMNGLELTREIRKFDGGKTAVVMLTGYNWDIIEEEATKDGVDGIIAKPLFSDNLIRVINAALESKGGEKAKPEAAPEAECGNSLAGRRILAAEDVDANAEILADLLDLEGMESERAENGQIAVEMFSSKPEGYYDAILMDVR